MRASAIFNTQHVATRRTWVAKLANVVAIYVVRKCCDRLAGARKYWANNVGICCVIICCDRLARAYKDLCWKVLEPVHLMFYAHRQCMNSVIAILLLVC